MNNIITMEQTNLAKQAIKTKKSKSKTTNKDKKEKEKLLNYSSLSINLTKNINATEKKNNGIYFTPPDTINKNIQMLLPYLSHIKTILEPSCGSCEYILALKAQYDTLKTTPIPEITGIEFYKPIYDSIEHIESNNIKLYNLNYLSFETVKKYDLIIGNPPYYVMKKNEVEPKYYEYFDGRPNIFILFIIKSLQLLNSNGILSFVLPKNFLNCLYYDKTRKYIYEHFKIIDIIECNDKYIETAQETVILAIQNPLNSTNSTNSTYCLNLNTNYTIFCFPNNILKLKELTANSTTLSQMGFIANIGTVVWNQCVDELTSDITKTRLIYSSDIKNNELMLTTYSNEKKKNYIDKQGETGPLLVINRGYGVGKYNFEYCLIEGNQFEYLIENHLICIRHQNMNTIELSKLYNKVMASFKNEKTKKFIELYFGNNAINATELCEIMPIYDI